MLVLLAAAAATPVVVITSSGCVMSDVGRRIGLMVILGVTSEATGGSLFGRTGAAGSMIGLMVTFGITILSADEDVVEVLLLSCRTVGSLDTSGMASESSLGRRTRSLGTVGVVLATAKVCCCCLTGLSSSSEREIAKVVASDSSRFKICLILILGTDGEETCSPELFNDGVCCCERLLGVPGA